MKINYICEWEKDKTLTWSGTTYSLYKALGKRCFINDYDIALNWFEKKLAKLFQIRVIGNKIETNKISNPYRTAVIAKPLLFNFINPPNK